MSLFRLSYYYYRLLTVPSFGLRGSWGKIVWGTLKKQFSQFTTCWPGDVKKSETFVSKNRSKFIFFLFFPQSKGPWGMCLSRLQVRTVLALVLVYFSLPTWNCFYRKPLAFSSFCFCVCDKSHMCARIFFPKITNRMSTYNYMFYCKREISTSSPKILWKWWIENWCAWKCI